MQAGSVSWNTGYKVLAVTLAMLAFAGNSLLCRLALKTTGMDAASFTSVRLVAGAVVLGFLVRWRSTKPVAGGDWYSALALFVYAAGFSWAYVNLSAATGALLLFGAVQVTMMGCALYRGERFQAMQLLGFFLACMGLAVMLLPGAEAPSWHMALLMILAGVAWGVYSLRGGQSEDFLAATAGNFWRASVLAVVLTLVIMPTLRLNMTGLLYAVLAGAVASGMGYALWYSVMKQISTTTAASVQLTVPVITALGAVALLGEVLSTRLLLCSIAVLGGVALVIGLKQAMSSPTETVPAASAADEADATHP